MMSEESKAIIITAAVIGLFISIIVGLNVWADYETAKLDYICVPE